MGDELLPELTDEEKQLLDDPKLYALLCRTAAYRRKHDECVRLRAEVARLRWFYTIVKKASDINPIPSIVRAAMKQMQDSEEEWDERKARDKD